MTELKENEEIEQPESKRSVKIKTEVKEKINSSIQPTKTLTETNEKPNTSSVKEQSTNPKVEKNLPKEKQP